MNNSERYADFVILYPRDKTGNTSFNYCARKRCYNPVYLQKQGEYQEDTSRRWRYVESVVVVSTEDGTQKHAFCSRKCAAQWLMSKER